MQQQQPLSGSPVSAFEYLRDEARDAHLAGDGLRVLHFSTVALNHVRSARGMAPESKVNLEHIRWAFYLGIYWLLDDWFLHVTESALKHTASEGICTHDNAIINWLLTALKYPLRADIPDTLVALPAEWLCARSMDVEDSAALTLALELCWHLDPRENAWKDVASEWIARSPDGTALRRSLEQLVARLAGQRGFRETGSPLVEESEIGLAITREQEWLLTAWRLYEECDFTALDRFLLEIAPQIRVESPTYSQFFRVFHMSRIRRESKEDQFLSLSRRYFVMSRQPADIFRELRDERFSQAYSDLARSGFADHQASTRFTCFRMAMLNQLNALRSWDIGAWMTGVRQRGQAAVELGARGDLAFARAGVLALVRCQGIDTAGKYPHLDRCIQIFDALPEEDRRKLVLELIATKRILWPSANRVLSELSDAIPDSVLPEVARWTVRLERDDYHSSWARTRMQFWGDILWWAQSPQNLIEVLKPAFLAKGADSHSWDDLHGTLIAAIVKGTEATASEILEVILGTEPRDADASGRQFSIVYNVAKERPELKGRCTEWLRSHELVRLEPFKAFMFRRLQEQTVRDDSDPDDPELSEWLRRSLTEYCDARLQETREAQIGGPRYHTAMRNLRWAQPEAELVAKIIAVVDADYVPFPNKVEPLACLASLAEHSPLEQRTVIAQSALRWLDAGILGRDFLGGGPLSTGQLVGFGPEAVKPAFMLLIDSVAENHAQFSGRPLAEWVLMEGLRQPIDVIHNVIRIALNLSIHFFREDMGLGAALVGIAESAAQIAMNLQTAGVLSAYRSVVFPENPAASLHDWLSSPTGEICRKLLSRRIAEASLVVDPEGRAAAASTIKAWGQSGIPMAAPLEEVRRRLAADCRLRVRGALNTS